MDVVKKSFFNNDRIITKRRQKILWMSKFLLRKKLKKMLWIYYETELKYFLHDTLLYKIFRNYSNVTFFKAGENNESMTAVIF